MNTVMDRTGLLQSLRCQFLLAALVLQALTPDALDLKLLDSARPPGPVLLLLDLWGKGSMGERDLGPAAFAFRTVAGLPVSSGGQNWTLEVCSGRLPQESPEDICQPCWPEMALVRGLKKLDSPTVWRQGIAHAYPDQGLLPQIEMIEHFRHTSPPYLFQTLCRLTC